MSDGPGQPSADTEQVAPDRRQAPLAAPGGEGDREARLRGGPAADPGQRADAVPGAGVDPLARLQRRAPELLLELRAARLVPRHRAGFPDLPPRLVDPAGDAGHPGAAGDLHLPRAGDDRPGRRRHHLLHLAQHHRPACLAGAAADLRAGGGGAGRAGRGGRPLLRAPAPADRLPLGPGRIADRHPVLHPAVVPAGAVGGVGRARHRRVRRADREMAAVPGRGRRRGDDRRPADRDDHRRASPGRRTTRSPPRTGSSAAPR